MPLSEEHKRKMRQGREKAAAARKNTTAMDPGHSRNEQVRRNKDANEELLDHIHAETEQESVDPSKLNRRDNEILRHFDVIQSGVENPQPGWRYFRLTTSVSLHQNGARQNVRKMHEDAKLFGAIPVAENDPEDKRFQGNDEAAGTTLRGLGDTVLYKQRIEDAERMDQYFRNKAIRQGAIEDQSIMFAQDRLGRQGLPNTMHAAAGDFSRDPYMANRFAPGEGQPVAMRTAGPRTTFTEGDLRRGSMKGPDGRTLQPGFERRQ